MISNQNRLEIPGTGVFITPGTHLQLGRFRKETWVADFGWFAASGNRSICGWYLTSTVDPKLVKPILLTDLADIYLVSH